MATEDQTYFEAIIDRRHSDSLKWAKYRDRYILPMWVADMDFRCPPPVIEALRQQVEHGIFGYAVRPDSLNAVIINWLSQQHGWTIQEDWLVWLPGLVCALNVACRGLVQPNQQVVTFTPIYPPFLSAPHYSQRPLIRCPLQYETGRYTFDLEQFENAVGDNTALLLLCSPHNPVGRVWTKDELEPLVEICLRKNILICSDEIHCDLVIKPTARQIPTATLSDAATQNTITLMAASKTFNVPGLNCAFAVIPNPQIRQRFRQAAFGIVPHVNAIGYAGTLAAFGQSHDWHKQLLDYLRQNRDLLVEAVRSLPGLKMDTPEATYLAWLDGRDLDISNLVEFFEVAGVGLSGGAEFDAPGFLRLNFGCPRKTLLTALDRIRTAVSKLRR
ncbi:MAG: putative C-S lyase [Planctomycetes bacterium]|nr:putative C-S lyase [Planctomycetota bacterium]